MNIENSTKYDHLHTMRGSPMLFYYNLCIYYSGLSVYIENCRFALLFEIKSCREVYDLYSRFCNGEKLCKALYSFRVAKAAGFSFPPFLPKSLRFAPSHTEYPWHEKYRRCKVLPNMFSSSQRRYFISV